MILGTTSQSRIRSTGPGCGTQHTSRVVNNACVLLAAAPTATPFIRHWRRLLLLLLVGEPLAKTETLQLLPRPLLLGEVALRSNDEEVIQRRFDKQEREYPFL